MKHIKRYLLTFIGFSICGMSISLYLLSGFGSDPVTLFADGLSHSLGLRIGLVGICYHFTVILISFFLDRSFLGVATLISFLTVGPSIGLYMMLFSSFVTPASPVVIRLVFYFIAFFGLSFGVSLYMSMKTGISASDLAPVIVSEKSGIQFRWCKVGFDIVVVIIGILLGGVFGWGTIFAALFTGPVIHAIRRRLERTLQPA